MVDPTRLDRLVRESRGQVRPAPPRVLRAQGGVLRGRGRGRAASSPRPGRPRRRRSPSRSSRSAPRRARSGASPLPRPGRTSRASPTGRSDRGPCRDRLRVGRAARPDDARGPARRGRDRPRRASGVLSGRPARAARGGAPAAAAAAGRPGSRGRPAVRLPVNRLPDFSAHSDVEGSPDRTGKLEESEQTLAKPDPIKVGPLSERDLERASPSLVSAGDRPRALQGHGARRPAAGLQQLPQEGGRAAQAARADRRACPTSVGLHPERL